MERLSVDYGKKSKLEFAIYPAPQVSQAKPGQPESVNCDLFAFETIVFVTFSCCVHIVHRQMHMFAPFS